METCFARDVKANINLLVIEQHSIDVLDGMLSCLGSLVVDEAVSSGSTLLICSNLARQDIAEGGESIVESLYKVISHAFWKISGASNLVVDLLVQILDENISLARLAKGRITLRPHDTAIGELRLLSG